MTYAQDKTPLHWGDVTYTTEDYYDEDYEYDGEESDEDSSEYDEEYEDCEDGC